LAIFWGNKVKKKVIWDEKGFCKEMFVQKDFSKNGKEG
jgi:hypothetical protein